MKPIATTAQYGVAPLITVAMLRSEMGSIPTDAEAGALATQIIGRASAAIERYVGYPMAHQQAIRDQYRTRSMGQWEYLRLSVPVTPSRVSVELAGVQMSAADWYVSGSAAYVIVDRQNAHALFSRARQAGANLVVEYDAGYTIGADGALNVPGDLAQAAIIVARAWWAGRSRSADVESQSVSGVADVSYAEPRAVPMAARDLLDPYRRVTV